jgi:hypothetical protein
LGIAQQGGGMLTRRFAESRRHTLDREEIYMIFTRQELLSRTPMLFW